MQKGSNITFTEDIIEEVAKEFDMKEEHVRAIYDTNIKYIRHLMDQDDTYALNIPYIGIMHINKGKLYKSMKDQERKKDKGYNIDEEKYNRNLKKMEKILELEHIRRESDAKGPITHVKRAILSILKYKTGKDLDQIEEIQRKVHG